MVGFFFLRRRSHYLRANFLSFSLSLQVRLRRFSNRKEEEEGEEEEEEEEEEKEKKVEKDALTSPPLPPPPPPPPGCRVLSARPICYERRGRYAISWVSSQCGRREEDGVEWNGMGEGEKLPPQELHLC